MELHQFFLFLAIILIAARLLSETVARFGIPSVIGELLAGLLIGPSLLGWVSPDTTMKLLAEIGITLLLFEVGMDTDLSRLARSGSRPLVVAFLGFTLPFALGYGVSAWVFGLHGLTALFIGGTQSWSLIVRSSRRKINGFYELFHHRAQAQSRKGT